MANLEPVLETFEDPAGHVEWTLSGAAATVLDMAVIVFGWTATETTGSAGAAVNVYDEPSHTGPAVLPIRLASGESAEAWYGDRGVRFRNGVHINVASGAAQGSVFYRRHPG